MGAESGGGTHAALRDRRRCRL